jgi:hypothetical protein
MPSKPQRRAVKPVDGPKTTQVQARMPNTLLDEFDHYIDRLNEKRSYPKLTRTDVILGVLDWVIRTNAKWETKP